MEIQKPKIVFYKKRQLGEKLNAAIDFMKENWRILFKMMVYIILPLSLLQGLSLSKTITAIITGDWLYGETTSPGEGLITLIGVIGSLYLAAMIYTLMKRYNDHEERLEGVTFAEVLPQVNKGVGRLLLFGLTFVLAIFIFALVGGVLFAVTGLSSAASLVFLLLFIVLFVALLVPFQLTQAILLFERNLSISQVWSQTFRLGYATWGGTFMLGLIASIVITVCALVVALPLIVFSTVQGLFSLSSAAASGTSATYGLVQYLLSVVVSFFSCVASIFFYVVMAYQYAHARETMDHVTLESDIDQFDDLGSLNE
ncbi:MAG: hypothetical protein LIP08_07140 [Bacteroides sp.]|nr:hypothetical protein [Bacteroides sp.]